MDIKKIKNDFPILEQKINGKKIVYLDNAATSQRPTQVIDAIKDYYNRYNASVHRGIYRFSELATGEYENSREKIRKFLNAEESGVTFTTNATEAINLVSYAWGEENIKKGDKIVISIMEHHSNLVPWQQLAERKGAKLEFLDIDEKTYELKETDFEKIKGAKLVSITHTSNVLGTINPVKEICKIAKETGAVSIVDGAQSAPHMKIDVKKIGCDFFVITGHKMLGPTGIGALAGKKELLEKMRPFIYGGSMIREVYKDHSTWNDLPYKFEAGTQNIEGVIGFGAAIDYLQKVGIENILQHEKELTKYALKQMGGLSGVETYGSKNFENRAGIVAFNVDKIHSHDIASLLDEEGIAIRSGHHCAMPLHTRLGLESTNRASFYIYNDREDVDRLVSAIENSKKVFGGVK